MMKKVSDEPQTINGVYDEDESVQKQLKRRAYNINAQNIRGYQKQKYLQNDKFNETWQKDQQSDDQDDQNINIKWDITCRVCWQLLEYFLFVYTLTYNSSLVQNLASEAISIKFKCNLLWIIMIILNVLTQWQNLKLYILEKLVQQGTLVIIIYNLIRLETIKSPYLLASVSVGCFIILYLMTCWLLKQIDLSNRQMLCFLFLVQFQESIVFIIDFYSSNSFWMAIDISLSSTVSAAYLTIQILRIGNEEDKKIIGRIDYIVAVVTKEFITVIIMISIILSESKIIE